MFIEATVIDNVFLIINPRPEKDMYSDLSYKRKRHAKRPESFSLTQKGLCAHYFWSKILSWSYYRAGTNSDLAYETMFDDDDDMLNQEQTIPWFDPNYLAPNENEDVSSKSPQLYAYCEYGETSEKGLSE